MSLWSLHKVFPRFYFASSKASISLAVAWTLACQIYEGKILGRSFAFVTQFWRDILAFETMKSVPPIWDSWFKKTSWNAGLLFLEQTYWCLIKYVCAGYFQRPSSTGIWITTDPLFPPVLYSPLNSSELFCWVGVVLEKPRFVEIRWKQGLKQTTNTTRLT